MDQVDFQQQQQQQQQEQLRDQFQDKRDKQDVQKQNKFQKLVNKTKQGLVNMGGGGRPSPKGEQKGVLKFMEIDLGHLKQVKLGEDYKEDIMQRLKGSIEANDQVNEYLEDFDEHIDESLLSMRDYLERIYNIQNGKLKKMYKRIEEMQRTIQQKEDFAKNDPIFDKLETDVRNYQEFTDILSQDLEGMGELIEQQSKVNIKLFEIKEKKTQVLKEKSQRIVYQTDLITKIQTQIKEIKKDKKRILEQRFLSEKRETSEFNEKGPENIIQVIEGQVFERLEERDYQKQKNISQNQDSINFSEKDTMIDLNQQSSVADSLYKLELFCGSQKRPKNLQKNIQKKYLAEENKKQQQKNNSISHIKELKNSLLNCIEIENEQQNFQDPNKKFHSLQNSISIQQQNKFHLEYQLILLETEETKRQNNLLKNKIILESNKFNQIQTLFENCLEIEKNYLEKLQKIVVKNDGLTGSLLFEMKKQKNILEQKECFQLHEKNKNLLKQDSTLQDRQIRNLIHDTLRHMWNKKFGSNNLEFEPGNSNKNSNSQQESVQSNQQSLEINWKQFQQFSSMQIIGLLALKPQVFNELTKILKEKSAEIHYNLNKNKVLNINTNPTFKNKQLSQSISSYLPSQNKIYFENNFNQSQPYLKQFENPTTNLQNKNINISQSSQINSFWK